MRSLKLNIISLTLPVMLAVPAWAQEPPPSQDHLNNGTNENFILLPSVTDKKDTKTDLTSKTSPFPAFFLIDTTLSTLVIDEALSIQVELHKVDFFGANKKDSTIREPKSEMVMLPRRKPVIIPSTISTKKITP